MSLDSYFSKYLDSVKTSKRIKRQIKSLLPVFAFLVTLTVFWGLKLIGITYAGEAFCGISEHTHSEECIATSVLVCTEDHEHTDECMKTEYSCGLEEHTHTEQCYSDITADVETRVDWEATLSDVTLGISDYKNIIAVANSQLGYAESELNFKIDSDGVRRGYTRYGQWFGNPYGDWSTMFTSFCLRYAGIDTLPISAGAESMKIAWKDSGLFKTTSEYTPVAGDIIFLDKNLNGNADATAIITEVTDSGFTVIEGDLDNAVGTATYAKGGSMILGFGTTSPKKVPIVVGNIYSGGGEEAADSNVIGTTVSSITNGEAFIIYTGYSSYYGTSYYAIDGEGNRVQIYVDSNGNITTDSTNINSLYWTFTQDGSNTYYIQNVSTGKYLHQYGSGHITTGRYTTVVSSSNGGYTFSGDGSSNYLYYDNDSGFTRNGSPSTFSIAKAPDTVTLWLDGTNGGLMTHTGSPDIGYACESGDIIKLPTEWESPPKYNYVLKGWYDVTHNKYYAPGDEITVTENTVLYADWIAATYNVGEFNENVVDTVSTNSFITTTIFDYNALFNIYSNRISSSSINSSSHSEAWQFVSKGTALNGQSSLGFSFVDYDNNGDISYAYDRNAANGSQSSVTTGLYNEELIKMLFDDNEYLGKHIVGSADHLFQFETDPNAELNGYYYYDSKLNAASYSQEDQRFYVYDYIERTSDSEKDGGEGEYSDFLPFNSPYADTNGQIVDEYTYNGKTNYQYDSKYDGQNSSSANVNANFWFGMAIDVDFFLPDTPGSGGNHDIFGNEMHFHFSGDDDVWILIDGKLVLDVGGIHGIQGGDINFSTGVIAKPDGSTDNLSNYGITEGEHTLTIYYLERGASQSNCEIYFNLAPRFDFMIRKEDVLTQEVLNGAEFSVFLDEACTIPAQLWDSEESHANGDPSKNTFTVTDGLARMWGMTSGKVYYIKETKPPDKDGYSLAAGGIICLTLDHRGYASYEVKVQAAEGETLRPGFTVHGLKVDVESQEAYVVVTNAEDWVKDVTTVMVTKKWNDSENHDSDLTTFYLSYKDEDGNVHRIREVVLGKDTLPHDEYDTDWKYIWTNLPRFHKDSGLPIEYFIEEAYYPGYTSTIEKLDSTISGGLTWSESYEFQNGETYLLGTSYGYLSGQSNSSQFTWVDLETAKTSQYARWIAAIDSSGYLTLTNEAGQSFTFHFGGDTTDITSSWFVVDSQTASPLKYKQSGTNGVKLYYEYRNGTWHNADYYVGNNNHDHYGKKTASEANALVFTPYVEKESTIVVEDGSFIYQATNTPISESNLTSVTVNKEWDLGILTTDTHLSYQIPVKLYANGYDTGRVLTLTLQNGWQVTFEKLPYKDDEGNVIEYTVEELWNEPGWEIIYGGMSYKAGYPGTYSTTITNHSKAGEGVELPSTGGLSYYPYLICGSSLVAFSLICGYVLRRKRERRSD